MVRVSQLTGTTEHAQHVQRIVDGLPTELQSILAQSGLKIKTAERAPAANDAEMSCIALE